MELTLTMGLQILPGMTQVIISHLASYGIYNDIVDVVQGGKFLVLVLFSFLFASYS